jgi:DNA repair photolyase
LIQFIRSNQTRLSTGLFGVEAPRDKNQRKGCNRAVSVDIGAYNSCMNGCLYCYANHDGAKVLRAFVGHDPYAELLVI